MPGKRQTAGTPTVRANRKEAPNTTTTGRPLTPEQRAARDLIGFPGIPRALLADARQNQSGGDHRLGIDGLIEGLCFVMIDQADENIPRYYDEAAGALQDLAATLLGELAQGAQQIIGQMIQSLEEHNSHLTTGALLVGAAIGHYVGVIQGQRRPDLQPTLPTVETMSEVLEGWVNRPSVLENAATLSYLVQAAPYYQQVAATHVDTPNFDLVQLVVKAIRQDPHAPDELRRATDFEANVREFDHLGKALESAAQARPETEARRAVLLERLRGAQSTAQVSQEQ